MVDEIETLIDKKRKMRNSIGNSVILTLSGESHGEMICATLDGLTAGLPVDEGFMAAQLSRRRPSGITDTPRVEPDDFRIVSGVFNGMTTGAPVTILIPNVNVRSSDYESNRCLPRPSHADYVAHVRHAGFEDYRGGGHFSGRVTAGIVAAGSLAIKALERRNIVIGTHILSCGGVTDAGFRDFESEIKVLNERFFPVIDVSAGEKMTAKIESARMKGDSVGGVIQTAVTGLDAGIGEPWFDSLEGSLARALFAIGGIKGVEFGLGFGFAEGSGSMLNDAFTVKDGKIVTITNNNGGINGGMSNGMPVVFNCAVKPTPSISTEQETVDLLSREPARLMIKGRHDPAIIRRICIVVSSMTAIVLCDMIALRYGQDYLR